MLDVENNAWKITLITRLLPFPFGLVNGLFALSSISFPVFLVGSFIGLLPFQLMWTYFGTTLRSIAEAVNGDLPFGMWQQFLLLLQIGLGIGLALYLYQLGKSAMMVPEPEMTIGEDKVEEQEDLDKDSLVFSEIVVVEVPECQTIPAVPFVSPAKLEVAPFVVEASAFAHPNLVFDEPVATNVMTRDSFIDAGRKREFGTYRTRARSFTSSKAKQKCMGRFLAMDV